MNNHRLPVDAEKDDVNGNVYQIVYFLILLRLPVRLLLRFRCVCKEWCVLIDTSVFKDTYVALRRAGAMDVYDDQLVGLKSTLVSDIPYEDMFQGLGLLINDLNRGIYSNTLTCWYSDYQSLAQSLLAPPSSSLCKDDFEISGIDSTRSRIINHFDGIVCFLYGPNWFDIVLANPALREFRKLPIPLFDINLGGFKPYTRGMGFGYDVSNNEYKVVVIVTVFEDEEQYSSHSPNCKHIGIMYRLSTNSWTILGDMSELVSCPFVSFPNVESIFTHGSLHWCIQLPDDHLQADTYQAPPTKYRILAFDVTNESFREIPFPPHGYRYYTVYHTDAMLPHLFLVDKSTVALVSSTVMTCQDEHKLQVWVMKEYGDTNSWMKHCSINVLPGIAEPLCFWKKDKILIRSVGSELICYDLVKGEPMDEQVYPMSVSGIRGSLIVTGHESFVSVKLVSQ